MKRNEFLSEVNVFTYQNRTNTVPFMFTLHPNYFKILSVLEINKFHIDLILDLSNCQHAIVAMFALPCITETEMFWQ